MRSLWILQYQSRISVHNTQVLMFKLLKCPYILASLHIIILLLHGTICKILFRDLRFSYSNFWDCKQILYIYLFTKCFVLMFSACLVLIHLEELFLRAANKMNMSKVSCQQGKMLSLPYLNGNWEFGIVHLISYLFHHILNEFWLVY